MKKQNQNINFTTLGIEAVREFKNISLGTKAKLLFTSLNKQQMQNQSTSARTAAKTGFKSSLLFRPATLAVNPMY